MARARSEGIAAVIRDVEGVAKRLRADVRKRAIATGLPKNLAAAAAQLRKRAAAAAERAEKYMHQVRLELERGTNKTAKSKRKPAKAKGKPGGATL